MHPPDYALLDAAGLNLQAVFALDALPAEVRDQLDAARRYRQLILLGHGGTRLWRAVQAAGIASGDPIDDFSVRTAAAWLEEQVPGCRHEIVYPGTRPVGLQALGKLAGWHHPSPFMVGINATWGTWYAYRVALLADSDFAVTAPVVDASPCAACSGRPCVAACPGGALGGKGFDLDNCIAYRTQADSACRVTCLARLACPVRREHRYDAEQLCHTYSISLRAIERES